MDIDETEQEKINHILKIAQAKLPELLSQTNIELKLNRIRPKSDSNLEDGWVEIGIDMTGISWQKGYYYFATMTKNNKTIFYEIIKKTETGITESQMQDNKLVLQEFINILSRI